MLRQVFKFVLVGVLATLVHLLIGFLLLQAGWNPLAANAVAFSVAFLVSFFGHLRYSFADQNVDTSTSLWKFVIVALIGFSCNEFLLMALLYLPTMIDYVALFISTATAAILTFLLSKIWAFKK